MATKYFCDRCDACFKEQSHLIMITIKPAHGITHAKELCQRCYDSFIRDFMNPARQA